MKSKEVFDAVIVGGGLTGYAAGVLMVKGGLRVAVVEGFPWEWWLREPAPGAAPFDNFSGAVLYGVPGHHPTTSLAIELGLPLNNPIAEGPVTFKSLEPGFQVLLPKRWVNLFSGPGEALRELERVYPGEGRRMEKLYREASRFHQKIENYWPLNLAARRRDGGGPLSSFLDNWASYHHALFDGRLSSAQKALEGLGRGELGEYARLFLFGLTRRSAAEASSRDLYDVLELTALPSCLINETGQRGIFHSLRTSFHKAGGTVYRTEEMPRVGQERKAAADIRIEERWHLLARWAVLDFPEGRAPQVVDAVLPGRRREAARPALHLALPIPPDAVPAGMGGHLCLNLDGAPEPLLLTLAPAAGESISLEVLTQPPAEDGGRGTAEVAGRVMTRIRKLLRFLPENLPVPEFRLGDFPACHGGDGFLGRLRYPGPPLSSRSFHREGRFILTGRGDYIGSPLNGVLGDARDLALWVLHRCRR